MKITHPIETVVLDVRQDLENGKEPLTKIMQAAKALTAHQSLTLITPFEPVPLFFVMKKLGFQHRSRQLNREHWESLFARELPTEEASPPHPVEVPAAASMESVHSVDARGLEPPQPLVKILTELEKLGSNGTLRAQTDRQPLHLLDALRERGFQSTCEEQPDGSWITLIHRA